MCVCLSLVNLEVETQWPLTSGKDISRSINLGGGQIASYYIRQIATILVCVDITSYHIMSYHIISYKRITSHSSLQNDTWMNISDISSSPPLRTSARSVSSLPGAWRTLQQKSPQIASHKGEVWHHWMSQISSRFSIQVLKMQDIKYLKMQYEHPLQPTVTLM